MTWVRFGHNTAVCQRTAMRRLPLLKAARTARLITRPLTLISVPASKGTSTQMLMMLQTWEANRSHFRIDCWFWRSCRISATRLITKAHNAMPRTKVVTAMLWTWSNVAVAIPCATGSAKAVLNWEAVGAPSKGVNALIRALLRESDRALAACARFDIEWRRWTKLIGDLPTLALACWRELKKRCAFYISVAVAKARERQYKRTTKYWREDRTASGSCLCDAMAREHLP